jgi:ribokinase
VTVYNIGSINIDYVYRVAHLVRPGETLSSQSLESLLGGKGANQSVALARAGCAVRHVGRMNAADGWAAEILAAAGVDTALLQQVDEASGHAIIQVDDQGENAIVLHGGANQGFSASEISHALADAGPDDWLLLQNECNAADLAFAEASRRKMRIAFNPAPMTQQVLSLPIAQCAVLILNETEAAALADETDEARLTSSLQARFPDTDIVLTLGARGAKLLASGQVLSAQAGKVDVVDTTGAGDTFVGYYLAAVIGRMAAQEALEYASAAAALSVTRAGATPSIPTAAEVAAWTSGDNT